MDIRSGDTIISLRQECVNAFAGVAPTFTLPTPPAPPATVVTFTPYVYQDTRIVQYSYDEDRTVKIADAAGLFDFSVEQAIYIREIRAHVGCGDITVVVGDRGTTDFDVTVATPAPVHIVFDRLPIAPSQVVKISTATGAVGGFVDVLFTKAVGH
jgi:hypothetical protein